MIQRRQFIGAVAGTLVAGGALSKSAAAATADLRWRCDVIKTVAHNRADRNPVVTGVSLQPAGNQLAIVGDDHHVCIYDIKTQSYVSHIDAHRDWIRAAVYSPNGSQLATAGNDRTLRIWRQNDWSTPLFTRTHSAAIIEVAYSHRSNKIATVGFQKKLHIYDSKTGHLDGKLTCPCPDNHAVAFSPNDELIAAGGRCGTVRVWNVATSKVVAETKAHRSRVRSLQFTDDGHLISAGDDQMIKIIDVNNIDATKALPRQAAKLYAVTLLPGNTLATGGSDNKIHLWQLRDQSQIGTLSGHTGTVSCLDVGPNKLVSGSFDTQVRLWHTEARSGDPAERQASGWNGLK